MVEMVKNNSFAVGGVCVLLVIVACALLYCCCFRSKEKDEAFVDYEKLMRKEHNEQQHEEEDAVESFEDAAMAQQQGNPPVAAEEQNENNETPMHLDEGAVSNTRASVPKDCFPKDQLTPQELLPTDTNSMWAQVNPAGQGNIGDNNLLTAGHHVGVNTVGQTLRNANLQLRSEPPNPQMKVSPWMQSTIEPDTNRRPMEIN